MADWTNFPLRYTLYENAFGTNAISTNSFTTNTVYSWQELETTYGVSSQLWYAARERNVAGNENQDGGYGWNETHPYLYEIATSNITFTDGASWTNSTTNTWLIYSNSVTRYDIDGYPIGDNELGSYEITNNIVWTNSLWIRPPVKYSEMARGVDSLWIKDGSDDAPYEFYVEWHLSTNDSVTLNEYFGTSGITDTNGTVAYPGIPYQTPQGAWARHMLGYRTNNVVTTNAWGLITDNGTSDAYGVGVSVIPMPLKLAEVRWVPDLYLEGFPDIPSIQGEHIWDESKQGWIRDSVTQKIAGVYTNGVWKYVIMIDSPPFTHIFEGASLGVSNTWVNAFGYAGTNDTSSMMVSETNTGVWVFHNIQPLFDTTARFLRPYTGSPEVVYSGYTNAAVVTIQGTILTNWNNNPLEFDTSAEETATVTGGTNETKFAITGADAWRVITNMTVDVDGIKGDSISVTYYSPTNYYLWSPPNYNGRKGSTDQLDEMFRSLNALQWTAMNLHGELAVTSSVPADVGTWTWDGYGWDDAAESVVTNFTDYTDVDGVGAVVFTSPDPNWTVVDTPTDLDVTNNFRIRFTSPEVDYRTAWNFQFRAEIAGTITLSNSHATTAQDATFEATLGSNSDSGGGSISAGATAQYSFGTLTNVFTGTSNNTNTLISCGAIGYTVGGTNIVYYDSAITYTLAEFRFARVWARRWSASVVPSMALSEPQQKDFTNLLADVTTQREMYLESDTPPSLFTYSTNFVFSPEVDDLRYDETNMVGQFTLVGTWTESTPIPTNIYADGEIGETIPYGSGVDWDQGWHIKFESSPDVIKGLYLIKWDVADGFRFGKVTNIYDWPLQPSPN